MSNTITIELSAEDRARLDKLTAALEKAAARPPIFCFDMEKRNNAEDRPPWDPAAAPEEATEAPEETTPAVIQPEPETPAEAAVTPVEPVKPTVTLAQIQQKVIQLAAGFGGSKKAAVREIVNAYAKKVTDLPEDKWAEVWDKLAALEKEG